MGISTLTNGIDKETNDEEEDNKEIVIGHLHMVGIDLKRREDARYGKSCKVFPPVGKQYTCYHRWQIGKCHHFPYMTCCYDDEEIAAESPYYGAQRGQIPTEVKGTKHDIEAKQVCKHIPHILRQPQVISLNDAIKTLCTLIRWSTLIGRHTTED